MRTRIKICGITSVDDARAAVAAGADALGLVFFAASKRFVTIKQAKEISQSLPPFVTLVGLFVDAPLPEVEATHKAVGLDLIQYHGNETLSYCDQIALPYIKAVRVKDKVSVSDCRQHYPTAKAILVDAYVKNEMGGTGQSFDWSLVSQSIAADLILAGGLNVTNVGAAIQTLRPYAVDVSSGVELSPGVKSNDKMVKFIEGVRHVDHNE